MISGWDKKRLKNYYFLYPGPGSKTVCLRAHVDCKMEHINNYILDFFATKHNLNLQYPILTFQGQAVDLTTNLSIFSEKALFLYHDGQIPDRLLHHKGKLWECLVCGNCWNDRNKRLKTNCQHQLLFDPDESTPITWGHTLDRHIKPWATPVGHDGYDSVQQEVPVQHDSPQMLMKR